MRTEIHHATPARTITVNQAIISGADIAREAQNHPEANPKQAWTAATRALVVRELLLQRAQTLELSAKPHSQDGMRETEEEALIRAVLEHDVVVPDADDATCRRYFEANQARFRAPDLYEPLHILFRASRDDVAAYARSLARANKVLEELRSAPGRFESLARDLSDCPSASEGGRLGQVAPGDTTPAFEAALRTTTPGTVHPVPVETPYGVHVLRLDRKVEGAVLPFERVRDRIAAYLEDTVWRRAVAQYVSVLAGQADIAGFDMGGATTPLVQ